MLNCLTYPIRTTAAQSRNKASAYLCKTRIATLLSQGMVAKDWCVCRCTQLKSIALHPLADDRSCTAFPSPPKTGEEFSTIVLPIQFNAKQPLQTPRETRNPIGFAQEMFGSDWSSKCEQVQDRASVAAVSYSRKSHPICKKPQITCQILQVFSTSLQWQLGGGFKCFQVPSFMVTRLHFFLTTVLT